MFQVGAKGYYGAIKVYIEFKQAPFGVKSFLGVSTEHMTCVSYSHLDSKRNEHTWSFLCDCGTIVEKAAYRVVGARGAKSCGCKTTTASGNKYIKHGHCSEGKPHPLHTLWRSMIDRCRNPRNSSYKYYGAKGIEVHKAWYDFRLFIQDIPPRPSSKHTLDRINSKGNYEPSNVRWATAKEQARNRTKSKTYTHEGKNLSIPELSELSGVHVETIRGRLRRGLTTNQAIIKGVRYEHVK